MSNLKYISAAALAGFVKRHIPAGLCPTVRVGPLDYEDVQVHPSITIIPSQKFALEPFQAAEADDSIADKLLLEIGYWEGLTEIQILDSHRPKREAIEQHLLNLLLGEDEFSSGTISLQTPALIVGGVQTAYKAACVWRIDDGTWRDELAFDDHRYSFLELATTLPALKILAPVYTINMLQASFVAGVDVDIPGTSTGSLFTIAADGSISLA